MVSFKRKLVFGCTECQIQCFSSFLTFFPEMYGKLSTLLDKKDELFFFAPYVSGWSCCAILKGVNIYLYGSLNLTCLTASGDASNSHLLILNFQFKQTFSVCSIRAGPPSLPMFYESFAELLPGNGHVSIELAEHFRMSISYHLYYNKITKKWNTLNSYLNKCSSVKNKYSPTSSFYENGELEKVDRLYGGLW